MKTRPRTAMNTWIWTKPEYTKYGIKEIVRIVFNPYNEKPSEILKFWVAPEFHHQCYAYNVKA